MWMVRTDLVIIYRNSKVVPLFRRSSHYNYAVRFLEMVSSEDAFVPEPNENNLIIWSFIVAARDEFGNAQTGPKFITWVNIDLLEGHRMK